VRIEVKEVGGGGCNETTMTMKKICYGEGGKNVTALKVPRQNTFILLKRGKLKVNLSLYTPKRHIGEVDIYFHPFLTSY
jgi:hypothetical protein